MRDDLFQNKVTILLNRINLVSAMHLSTEEKQEIFEKYGQGKNDTGSPESQIALFSVRIKHLTEHLKSNHKDLSVSYIMKIQVHGYILSLRTIHGYM